MDAIEAHACAAFRSTFGHPPTWVASAPGRINLIGEFTDFNGGFVLPMAIGHRTAIAAAPNRLPQIILRSEATDQTAMVDLTQPLAPEPKGHWLNYPKGVLAGYAELGFTSVGFNAFISSTVPIGAGLSSSAALEAAMALLLEQLYDFTLTPLERALLCQRAEHRYAQVPCGLMDQFISLTGQPDHVLLLDCKTHAPTWIPWRDPEIALLVLNTHVKHAHENSGYAARHRACERAAQILGLESLCEAELDELCSHADSLDEESLRCAQHVISEHHRTRQAAALIRERDWIGVGQLMYDSHESLRSDYKVSCRELDLLVDTTRDLGSRGGVLGARMTGGGFGGCALVLLESSRLRTIRSELDRTFEREVGRRPSSFITRPCAGARSQRL